MRFEELAGRDVVIWGAGREGLAAHAELVRRGVAATFAVTGDGATSGGGLPAGVAVDAHAVARLEAADVVIKSPGVPRSSPVFQRLQELGVAITSLTDLWLSANSHRVLAVTGTKGKSTTSALAHHLLTGIGRTASLVGNGGTPVTAGDHADAEFAVAEVSSYQAVDLTTSPRVAVVTSLFPEHLPWHGGFERYVADKLNLIAHGPEVVVVPSLQDDPSSAVRERVGGDVRLVDPASIGLRITDNGLEWDGVGRLGREEVALEGRHNLVNLGLAMTAVSQLIDGTGSGEDLLAAAASFAPLAHRLERVPSPDGRTWVDDSLATAPEAVVAALETYPTQRVTLVLGGADRGLSFDPLLSYLSQRAPGADVSVIAVGPAGARWMSEGAATAPRSRLAVSFGQAMEWAGKDPTGTDVVLLSPGAPSFDEFSSFEERSAVFRAAAATSEKA